MSPIDHSRFYRYDEFVGYLRGFANQYPRYATLETIGHSFEGRPIYVVVLTDIESGAAEDKPAFWIDGNIHATEVSASAVCLYMLEWLLTRAISDPDVAYCLASRTIYMCPRVNPDGAEWALADDPRFVRSSTRRYPFDEEPVRGLIEQDIDGNGRILQMRVRDDNGPWKEHPQDGRLLVRREPGDRGGRYYRVMTEGRLTNYDGSSLPIASSAQNLDLNRNFPAHWRQENEQEGAGPYPGSEPEARSLIEFICAHENICSGVSFHTFAGVLLRPSSQCPDDKMLPEDLWAYQKMGEKGAQLTGYPALSIHDDFAYYPGKTIGGSFDWLYEHRGAFFWVVEIWNANEAAGIGKHDWIHWFRDHPPEDDLKLLKWSDKELKGQAYHVWQPFDHPELGPVEIGGWDGFYAFRNPPPSRRLAEWARFPQWLLWQALLIPKLELREVEVKALSASVDKTAWRVRVTVQNSGWLPSYVTKMALRHNLLRGVLADLELPASATLLSPELRQQAGELEGWSNLHTAQSFWVGASASADRVRFEWIVEAPLATPIKVHVRHQRAGSLRTQIMLQ